MNIEGTTILITGANRGIGRALVEEALKRGAKRLYAGTRQPFTHSDGRVTPLTLDVTNAAQIQDAVEKVAALDILINNAGVDLRNDLSDRTNLERHPAVNLFGTYSLSQAFLPLLALPHGAMVNVLSLAALASVPFTPAFSVSKATAFSLTRSLRALWAGRGVKVHAVFAGPVDTDMTPYLDIPKFSPESVARHPRQPGKRRRGHLPRSHVGVYRRGLAHGRNQGAGAPIRSLRATKRGEGCVTRLSITIIGVEHDR